LQWEVFLPEQYKVKDFGGDAIAASLLPPVSQDVSGMENEYDILGRSGALSAKDIETISLLPGQLGGIIVDPSGAVVANARVTVTQVDNGAVRNVVTDSSGRWIVSNMPSGRVKVVTEAQGFQRLENDFYYDGSRPAPLNSALRLGAAAETVTITAMTSLPFTGRDVVNFQKDARKAAEKQQLAASSNVTNLQQRVSGVLPVGVEVPRAGNSYHFVRPLVLDEETKVTFTYKSK